MATDSSVNPAAQKTRGTVIRSVKSAPQPASPGLTNSISLAHVWACIQEEKSKIKESTTQIKRLEGLISGYVEETVETVRRATGKPEGSVRVEVDGITVKHDIPKRVEWDTAKLNDIAAELEGRGINPMEIMEYDARISERVYDSLSRDMKMLVNAARTIKHGTPKIEVIIEESE